jgi:hypothetical protein
VVIVAVLGIAFASALAGATAIPNQPNSVSIGEPRFTILGGITPTVLSKTKPAPIALTVFGQVHSVDGSHPPALTELAFEADRNIAVDLRGYPSCHGMSFQIDPPMTLAERCRSAIIGKGIAHFEIKLGEAAPIPVQGRLQIINAGREGGIPTLLVSTYITVPTPAEIVATVQIKKIDDGRYGTEATVTLPKIAGGGGSVTSFEARIKRRLPLEGKRFSPVTAKCPDGKLAIHVTGTFLDYETSETTTTSSDILRTCTGR